MGKFVITLEDQAGGGVATSVQGKSASRDTGAARMALLLDQLIRSAEADRDTIPAVERALVELGEGAKKSAALLSFEQMPDGLVRVTYHASRNGLLNGSAEIAKELFAEHMRTFRARRGARN